MSSGAEDVTNFHPSNSGTSPMSNAAATLDETATGDGTGIASATKAS
jgi:hypothetical protein